MAPFERLRELEDAVPCDRSEGVNSTKLRLALRFQRPTGPSIQLSGDGNVGQQIAPHYILSLHGASISLEQRQSFGGNTFGVRSLSRLSAEILCRASKLVDVRGYRFGPISYRYTALKRSYSGFGAPICVGGIPSEFLVSVDTDVLRKDPVKPFVDQDEWRVVIFTNGYYKDNPKAPLELKVDPKHFYGYQADA